MEGSHHSNGINFLDYFQAFHGVNVINILRGLFCRYPFAKELQSQTVIR